MDATLRPGRDSDTGFIYSSWLQSFREINTVKLRTGGVGRDGYPETKDLPTGPALLDHDKYFFHQRGVINAILPVSKILCAVNPDDDDQLYGYAIYRDLSDEIRIVSYVYTKHTFRKMGIARKLFEALAPCHIATHGGPFTRKLLAKVKLVYDPSYDIKLVKDAR